MPDLDIKRILTEHNIPFVDKGVNVGRNAVCLHCIYCSEADHSKHLRIKLNSNYFRCWRNSQHSGPIQRLLKDLGIPLSDIERPVLAALMDGTYFRHDQVEVDKPIKKIFTKLPLEFVEISEDTVFARPYLNYLSKRGFKEPKKFAREYKLQRSLGADKWSARVIVPVWVGPEVSWTGRAIGTNPVRYLSPTEDEARSIKECIGNYHNLTDTKGNALVITEGIFDAIKVDYYCSPKVRATCVYGLTATDAQVALLKSLCPNFERVVIALDAGSQYLPQKIELARLLGHFSPEVMNLPSKDFGEMDAKSIKAVLEKYF